MSRSSDQTAADSDQTAADSDQTAADSDQTAADSDQTAADTDQAASDQDLVHGGDPLVHDISRELRDRGAQQRQESAGKRVAAAAVRDGNAGARDLAAVARDEAAERRDREPLGNGGRPATGGESRAVQDRARAAADRATTVDSRARAASDREHAARDRDQAAHDRTLAHADREALQEQLAITETDQLTGARTRAAGLADLKHEIDRARRASGRLAIAYVDVVGLKAVNDADGHGAGDALLRHAVHGIRSHLRSYDLIVRVGGDEFVCMMPGTTIEDARQRFGAIQTTLAADVNPCAIKAGFAGLVDGESAGDLIQRADADLLGSALS